jgi:hypothetical protein
MYIVLNATDPPAPAGAQNVHFREDSTHLGTAADPKPVTAFISPFTGDSGSGGASGLVPAPAAGDAAAGKVLKADGTWYVPPTKLTAGWVVPAGSAAPASGVGPVLVVPRAAIFTRCRIAIKATDTTNALTVFVCQNGSSVFTMSVAAGATALQTATLAFTVAADDLLTLNITAGSTTWDFTLQLETAS